MLEVIVDRMRGNMELSGNLLIAIALGQKLENIEFPVGELFYRDARVRSAIADPLLFWGLRLVELFEHALHRQKIHLLFAKRAVMQDWLQQYPQFNKRPGPVGRNCMAKRLLNKGQWRIPLTLLFPRNSFEQHQIDILA